VEIFELAKGLVENEEGIWVSRDQQEVSYPKEAHACCRQLEDKSFWFAHRSACVTSVIRRFSPEGAIFDVGGGNGFVARALNQAGFETVLVEPGMTGVRNARTLGLKHIICSTLQDARFEKHSLPAVGVFDVLEHVQDDKAFLRMVARCLKPGGMLYITVPAYGAMWSSDDERAGHFRRYTMRGLRAKLAVSGFREVFGSYFFSFLPLPIFFLRTLPSRLARHRQRSLDRSHLEHGCIATPLRRFAESLFSWEVTAFEKGWRLPFGGSLLLVARTGN